MRPKMCRRRAPYSKAPDLTMAAQAAPSSRKHNASRRFGKGAGLLFLFLAPEESSADSFPPCPVFPMIFPLILRLTLGCVCFRSSARGAPRALPLQPYPPSSVLSLFLRRPPAALIRAAPRRFGSTPHLRSGFPAPPASSPGHFPAVPFLPAAPNSSSAPPRTPARVFPLRGRPAVRLSRRGLFLIPAQLPAPRAHPRAPPAHPAPPLSLRRSPAVFPFPRLRPPSPLFPFRGLCLSSPRRSFPSPSILPFPPCPFLRTRLFFFLFPSPEALFAVLCNTDEKNFKAMQKDCNSLRRCAATHLKTVFFYRHAEGQKFPLAIL